MKYKDIFLKFLRRLLPVMLLLFSVLYKAQGRDLLIVVDQSASMSNTEFSRVEGYIKQIAQDHFSCNPANRVALVSYAYDFAGTSVYIDTDFTTDTTKFNNFNHRSLLNVADYAPRTFRAIGDALDGVANSDIKSPQKTLNRKTDNEFVVFFFTDANRNGGLASSYLVDTGINADHFKVYNDFKKNRGANFVVLKGKAENLLQINSSIAAAAAIASVGGSWNGNVEDNPGDPEGSGTKPRKMIYTNNFTLSPEQIAEINNLICPAGSSSCYQDPNTTTTGTPVNHGITLLKRAGTENGNWPMIRSSAHTALESNTKGFVITRMSTAQINSIAMPVEGMMVYDTDDKCLKIYVVDNTISTNSGWKCFSTPACP